MRKFFTSLTVLVLLAFAAVHASRLFVDWQLQVEGTDIRPMISFFVAAISFLLAIGVLWELRQTGPKMPPLQKYKAPTRSLESRSPLSFTVEKGKKYRAQIRLSLAEQWFATNQIIADKFAAVGFTEVVVIGSGAERIAEGIWPLENQAAEMPSQIVSAEEIREPAVAASVADEDPAKPA